MNIKQDENGYIYFNELLYKVMKKKYGIKNVKNKVLADKELAAYVKNNNIQKKKSQGLISDNKMYLVNPFLQFMYYKISFNTWMHFVRQIKEQEIIQQNLRGSCCSDEDYSISESDISSLEDSEYSYETERIELIDSEYESLNENDEKNYNDEETKECNIHLPDIYLNKKLIGKFQIREPIFLDNSVELSDMKKSNEDHEHSNSLKIEMTQNIAKAKLNLNYINEIFIALQS